MGLFFSQAKGVPIRCKSAANGWKWAKSLWLFFGLLQTIFKSFLHIGTVVPAKMKSPSFGACIGMVWKAARPPATWSTSDHTIPPSADTWSAWPRWALLASFAHGPLNWFNVYHRFEVRFNTLKWSEVSFEQSEDWCKSVVAFSRSFASWFCSPSDIISSQRCHGFRWVSLGWWARRCKILWYHVRWVCQPCEVSARRCTITLWDFRLQSPRMWRFPTLGWICPLPSLRDEVC